MIYTATLARYRHSLALLTLGSLPLLAAPQTSAPSLKPAVTEMTGTSRQRPVISGDQQLIRQQEQQQALEQRLTPDTPDIRLSSPADLSGPLIFPQESPCFVISHVILSGTDSLPPWLALQRISDQASGHCLGGKGINLLMSRLQNQIIDHGFITTRVLAPQQDLTRGKLRLTIIPGNIRQVKLTPDSGRYISLYSTFPAHKGNLVNLRDLEQGLENLLRLPTVQATMEILPGNQPGESDIALHWQQQRVWRIAASLDDAGTRSTGRYQGGMTLSLDNPLSLSDLFYISGSTSLQNKGRKSSDNLTGHYSVPAGYWMSGLTASRYSYYQTIAGMNGDYRYRGKSSNLSFRLSRILHRNGRQKTTLSYEVLTRQSANYINDTEVEVQRRRTSAWRAGLQYRHTFSQATLDSAVSYQQGTRWFGAIPAPEESFGEATALSQIVRLSSQITIPFTLVNRQFRYSVQYLWQYSHTPLTPQDQFAIGSRWTVRGFDGERTLNADRGWFIRNDLSWPTPAPSQELYLGMDYGQVSGHGTEDLVGTTLAGGAIGIRGLLFNTGYDLFAAMPFSRPDGFRTSPLSVGFSLNWQY